MDAGGAPVAAGLDASAASKPDLVITDLSLEDSDGLELIEDINRGFPDLPVPTLSMHDELIYAERALRRKLLICNNLTGCDT